MGVAPVGHSEGGVLVIFKCYLLRQHNVADREVPLGAEAPSGSAFAVFVELVDIHRMGAANAVMLAAVAARHFEMPVLFVFFELSRG